MHGVFTSTDSELRRRSANTAAPTTVVAATATTDDHGSDAGLPVDAPGGRALLRFPISATSGCAGVIPHHTREEAQG